MAAQDIDPDLDAAFAGGASTVPTARTAAPAGQGVEPDLDRAFSGGSGSGGVDPDLDRAFTPQSGAPTQAQPLPAHVTPQSSWSETGEAIKQNAPAEWSNWKQAAKNAFVHPIDTAKGMVEGVGNLADSAGYSAGEYLRGVAKEHPVDGWDWRTGAANALESGFNLPSQSDKPAYAPPPPSDAERAALAAPANEMVAGASQFIAHPATSFANAPLSTAANVASLIAPELRFGKAAEAGETAAGAGTAGKVAKAAETAADAYTAGEKTIGYGAMQTPDYAEALMPHGLEPSDITGAAREAMAGAIGAKPVLSEAVKEGIAAGASDQPVVPRHITTGEAVPEVAQGAVADAVATGHDAIRDRMGAITHPSNPNEAGLVDHAALGRSVEQAYADSATNAKAAYDRAFSGEGNFGPSLPRYLDAGMNSSVVDNIHDFPAFEPEEAGGPRAPNWDAARQSPSLTQTSAAYDHVTQALNGADPANYNLGLVSRLRKDLQTFQQAARGDDAHGVGKLIEGFDGAVGRASTAPGAAFERDTVQDLSNARRTYAQHIANFREAPVTPIKQSIGNMGVGPMSPAAAHGVGANIGRDLMHPIKGPATYDHLVKIGAKGAADQYIREHVLQQVERGGGSVLKHTPDQVAAMLKQPHVAGAFTPAQVSQVKLANAARRLYSAKPSLTKKLSRSWVDNIKHMALRYGPAAFFGAHGKLVEAMMAFGVEPQLEKILAQRTIKQSLSGAPKAGWFRPKGAAATGADANLTPFGRAAVGAARGIGRGAAYVAPGALRAVQAHQIAAAGQDRSGHANGGVVDPIARALEVARSVTGRGGLDDHSDTRAELMAEADNSPHTRASGGALPDPAAGPYGGQSYVSGRSYVPKSIASHGSIHPGHAPEPLLPVPGHISQPGTDRYIAAIAAPRAAHARGGKVGHDRKQELVNRLLRGVEAAKKEERARTSVILRQPDEHVAKALRVAQDAI